MKRLEHESESQHANAKRTGSHANVTTDSNPLLAESVIPPARTSLAKWLFWSFAFLIATMVSATLGVAMVLMAPLSATSTDSANAPQDDEDFSLRDLWRRGFRYQVTRPVNVLVMGIDRVPDVSDRSPEVFSGRSDTMLLVRVDPTDDSASILSIPRDTRVEIPEVGIAKINHANMVGGPDLAAQVISSNLNGVPIDRYVRVSTAAFRELVDLLGGVEVFVPEPMFYVDNTQGLEIDLEQGWQTLNGEQAEQFARFRNDGNGDIGRVQRQQQLIRALRDRLTSPAVLPRLPQAIQLVQQYVDTNLTLEEMLALVNFGLDLEQDDFRMVLLPGRFSTPDEYVASYWVMDPDGLDQVMQEYFQLSSVGLLSQRHAFDDLRIAIQNASSEPELASQVAAYLQSQGFDNVYIVQDWPDQQRQTQIIVQRGDLQSATMLETLLGVGQVVAASTGDLESDLTIRVGEDWSERIDG